MLRWDRVSGDAKEDWARKFTTKIWFVRGRLAFDISLNKLEDFPAVYKHLRPNSIARVR